MKKYVLAFQSFVFFTLGVAHGVFSAENAEAEKLVASLSSDVVTERDNAEQKLRGMGSSAVKVLREAKFEKDDATSRARNILTDVALETAKIDPLDADLLHEIAREEGKGKRYTNAERLYRRAEELYDQLKDDANRRKDGAKKKEYDEKRKLCDRMKDKAGHKATGDSHSGIDLGFVRVGREHDMSEEWE